MISNKLLLSPLAVASLTLACYGQSDMKPASEVLQKPNIIFILADDLGYGDLSCYGQVHFKTPNIDLMASEGMRFTQHYAGSTVCAPSRSSLLTGLHTGHTPIRGNKEWNPEGQWPMPANTYTLANMLKESGYITGAFGKWGLGYPGSDGDPNMQGFDEFYGYNCQRIGHNYYPYHLWHNQEKVILQGNIGYQKGTYGPDEIHKYALEFIENNKDTSFFMYYPTIIPHAELSAPEDYMLKHRGKYNPELNYDGEDDGPNYKNGGYGSQSESHAAFAAMINVLDDHVGEILEKLKELGIERNTLVIFTSDNGPHLEGGADPDFFDSNGPLKGYKRDLYEGGIRVPMIAWNPGKINEGTINEHISAFWDVMPTLAEFAGIPTPNYIDGISFLPSMYGKNEQKEHSYLYWEFHERGGSQAIRKDKWKLILRNVFDSTKTTTELYDLSIDLNENINVAKENQEIVKELLGLLDKARTPSNVFRFRLPQKE